MEITPQKPMDEMTPSERLGLVKLLVMEFEGVVSDGRTQTDDQGRQSAATLRADELGLAAWLAEGNQAVVIARQGYAPARHWAQANRVTFREHTGQKNTCLQAIVFEHMSQPRHLCYVGCDLDDLPAMNIAGTAVAVAGANPWCQSAAHLVLSRPGGGGALRELIDLMLKDRTPQATPGI